MNFIGFVKKVSARVGWGKWFSKNLSKLEGSFSCLSEQLCFTFNNCGKFALQ